MKLDHPHSFSKEEALARVQALTEYWATKHGVHISWDGNRARVDGKVRGITFSGAFTVDGAHVAGDVKAGFLAEKLGGRQYVEGKLQDYLDPANSLEVLRARLS